MPRITGNLHENLHAFTIISRGIILVMGNVSDRSCTKKNQNTFYMQQLFSRTSSRL